MKNVRNLFPLVGFVFLFTTGASFIDKETKANVVNLNDRMSAISRQEMAHHAEAMRLLKEQRDQLQILIERFDALQRQTSPILAAQPQAAVEPAVTEAPQKKIETASPEEAPKTTEVAIEEPSPAPPLPEVKAIETAAPPAPVVETTPPSAAVTQPTATVEPLPASEPQMAVSNLPVIVAPPAPPSEVPSSPHRVLYSENTSIEINLTRVALFATGMAVMLLIIALIRIKRSEARLRKIIWKSEMGALRDELSQPRPKSNTKIQVTGTLPKSNAV